MQIGVDSFGAVISEPATGLTLSPVQRMENLLEEIGLADQVGLDVFRCRRTPSERVRGFSASGYPGRSSCSHQEIFA